MTAKKTTRRRNTSPADPVTGYARDVVDGAIVAGPHVRDACARHLRDMKSAGARGWHFDADAAQRAIGFFAEVLHLNGGEHEGKPFALLPWQAFVVGSLFGWKGADGFRRFRVAYVETGKGSGKSPLVAGIGLYCLLADGEPRAEVYAAATKRDQAMILFRDAVAMVEQSPGLKSRIFSSGGKGREWNLAHLESGSFFRPIASDSGQSGPRPHCALLDEIHEHPDGKIVELIRAGTKGRRQAIIVMITNSGAGRASTCWEYHEFATRVASGAVADDSFFSYVCALDEGDDPFRDESVWIKANPSLGHTFGAKYLREQVTQARGMPSKESVVRRLNFCQWVDAADPWITALAWGAAGAEMSIADFRGRRAYAGLDLSSTTDLTAFVVAIAPDAPGDEWRVFPYFWIPADGVAERAQRDRVPFDVWASKGIVETTPGRAISKSFVAQRVAQICADLDVRAIAFDRWRIEDFRAKLAEDGVDLPLIPFGQGFKDMSPAVDELERRILNGELRHPSHPVLTWNASNAVVEKDAAGNRKFTKEKAIGRIDGVVALAMAVGATLQADEVATIEQGFVIL